MIDQENFKTTLEEESVTSEYKDIALIQCAMEDFLAELMAIHRELKTLVGPESQKFILQRYEEFLLGILPGFLEALKKADKPAIIAMPLAPEIKTSPAAEIAPTSASNAPLPAEATVAVDTLQPKTTKKLSLDYNIYLGLKRLIPLPIKVAIKKTFLSIRKLDALYDKIQENIRARRRETDHWLFDVVDETQIPGLAAAIVEKNLDDVCRGIAFATELDSHPSSATFIFDVFANTWKPLVGSLNARSIHTAWCGMSDRTEEDNYGAAITEKIPTTGKLITSFLGIFATILASNRSQILFCAESFYSADWTAETSVIQMAFNGSIFLAKKRSHLGNQNMHLLMYDGIKPLSKKLAPDFDQVGINSAISYFYRRMMSAATKVIYNSNTDNFAEFNRYAIPLSAPAIYFPRYTDPPTKPKNKLALASQGHIHMVCISVCLSDFREPSRDNIDIYIKSIILQKIHFHYYSVDRSASARFQKSLPPEFRSYFHHHPIVTDQKLLVEELQQFHIGLTPGDHTAMAEGISNIKCRFYRDAGRAYMDSTVATSSIVYSAAGLPCVMAMGFPGGKSLIGSDTVIQPTLSEYGRLREILQDWDLPRRIELAEKKRHNFWIDTHVDKLINYLKL